MPTLIKHLQIERGDDWQFVDTANGDLPCAAAKLIVPADFAVEHLGALCQDGVELGVSVPGDAELEHIEPLLGHAALIAIDFPAFNDGRGLSLAVLLRTRCQFRGELRAIGDVHTDMTHYLHRCGFDSFLLPDGRDPQVALKVLASLTDFYQGSVLQPLPAFRRMDRGAVQPGARSKQA
jgi:uncharacterized protein (DUF934 family)